MDADSKTSEFSAAFGVAFETGGARLEGRAWWDLNHDGIRAGFDPPIWGVLVRLYSNMGVLIGTTYTDANGQYQFPAVPQGIYIVTFQRPVDFPLFTKRDQGTDDTVDSDVDANGGVVAPLTAGQTKILDAGLILA